jgi:hypothetical protein
MQGITARGFAPSLPRPIGSPAGARKSRRTAGLNDA